jgi:hypothetical protein
LSKWNDGTGVLRKNKHILIYIAVKGRERESKFSASL